MKRIESVYLDSMLEPLEQIMHFVTFDGQHPVYIQADESDECVVYVCDEPFTQEDIAVVFLSDLG